MFNFISDRAPSLSMVVLVLVAVLLLESRAKGLMLLQSAISIIKLTGIAGATINILAGSA